MAKGIRGPETRYGWAFTAPAIVIIGVFLVLPILLAVYVSFGDWNGLGSPLRNTQPVGLDNYAAILTETGLAQRDFGTALRNNLYYVLLVVPLQTALALFLAVQVNRRVLRGRGVFRTAFYFPSVTSSIAITTIFLWLFLGSGAVNATLAVLGIEGPNWMADPTGIIHGALAGLGVAGPPEALTADGPLGLTWWSWLSGPSVAMCVLIIMAIFTTSGTFMLLFLAALQNVSGEIDEAASLDGAGSLRKFFSVTLPMLKPTLFTVITLGLIGTWQVFDQVYLIQNGDPGKTTLTPAYLAFTQSFQELEYGQGAAIAFILFGIIVAFTVLQRVVLRDRDAGRGGARRAERAVARLASQAEAAEVAAASRAARSTGRSGR
jgi:multiple sugar transport system permease protein